VPVSAWPAACFRPEPPVVADVGQDLDRLKATLGALSAGLADPARLGGRRDPGRARE